MLVMFAYGLLLSYPFRVSASIQDIKQKFIVGHIVGRKSIGIELNYAPYGIPHVYPLLSFRYIHSPFIQSNVSLAREGLVSLGYQVGITLLSNDTNFRLYMLLGPCFLLKGTKKLVKLSSRFVMGLVYGFVFELLLSEGIDLIGVVGSKVFFGRNAQVMNPYLGVGIKVNF